MFKARVNLPKVSFFGTVAAFSLVAMLFIPNGIFDAVAFFKSLVTFDDTHAGRNELPKLTSKRESVPDGPPVHTGENPDLHLEWALTSNSVCAANNVQTILTTEPKCELVTNRTDLSINGGTAFNLAIEGILNPQAYLFDGPSASRFAFVLVDCSCRESVSYDGVSCKTQATVSEYTDENLDTKYVLEERFGAQYQSLAQERALRAMIGRLMEKLGCL